MNVFDFRSLAALREDTPIAPKTSLLRPWQMIQSQAEEILLTAECMSIPALNILVELTVSE
jgi:hypothetical protein